MSKNQIFHQHKTGLIFKIVLASCPNAVRVTNPERLDRHQTNHVAQTYLPQTLENVDFVDAQNSINSMYVLQSGVDVEESNSRGHKTL